MGSDRLDKLKIIICAFILQLLILAGCKSAPDAEIPELVEPIAGVDSFCVAEKRDVLSADYFIADIVAKEYCHFLKNASSVSEITVDIGQYVHEGELLAKIDSKEIDNSIEKYSILKNNEFNIKDATSVLDACEINVCRKKYEMAKKTYDEIVSENCRTYGEFAKMPDFEPDSDMTYHMYKAEQDAKEAMEDAKVQLDIAMENAEYNALLSKHKITMYDEEIERLSEQAGKTEIRAKHDGVVTYVKDMSAGNSVQAFENIVIVSDDNDLSLEIDEEYSGSFYNKVKTRQGEFYALRADSKLKLILHEYSNAEYVAMESNKDYPNMQFDISVEEADAFNMKAGEKIPVRYFYGGSENTICVSAECVENDESGSFVYVHNNGEKVKRNVVTGYSNKNDIEILEGLNEGELVYCVTKSLPPEKYITKVINKGDFTIKNPIGAKPIVEYTKGRSYIQKKKADVTKVNVKSLDEVKKGDLLCVLSIPDGKSKITEKENNIEDAKSRELADAFSIRKQRGKLTEAQKLEKPVDEKELIELELALLDAKEAVSIIKNNASKEVSECELSLAKSELDSDGNRYIYSDIDGIISDVNIIEGKSVSKDDVETELLRVEDVNSFKIGTTTGDDFIALGNEVTFINKKNDKDTLSFPVVGNTGRTDRVYLSSYEDKVYVTKCNDSRRTECFIDAKDIKENYFDYELFYNRCMIRDALSVPKGAINSEVKDGESSRTYYYVWKLINNIPVKTYVETVDSVIADNVCVIYGLKEGDEVIYNTSSVSEE